MISHITIMPKTTGYVAMVAYERPEPSQEFAYSDLDDLVNGLIRLLGPVPVSDPLQELRKDVVLNEDDDGWRVWEGGPRDRPPGLSDTDIVEVRLGGGEDYHLGIPQPVTIWAWQWRHNGTKDDIIAYRVVKP